MHARADQQNAYLLHQYDYRETSRIAEFLTREQGRVAVVARGVRQPRKSISTLQLFRPYLIAWSGRELATLRSHEPVGNPLNLRGNALLAAFYMNELLLKLLGQRDPHPEIYDLYQSSLEQLQAHPQFAIVLRYFERDLLGALGYALNLDVEPGTGEAVSADRMYRFDPMSGPLATVDSLPTERLVSGAALLALANSELDSATTEPEARRILRIAVDVHLGGKILKSRKVLREMYRTGDGGSHESE